MGVSLTSALLLSPVSAFAATGSTRVAPLGIPIEFLLFGLMLVGVAVFHTRPLTVALSGLAAIATYELLVSGFPAGSGLSGLLVHLAHEWVILANLWLLLVGFAVLSSQFERSNIPETMPRFLPANWTGGLALLGVIFVMSAFLDNIAAAVIGGVMAKHLYRGRVSIAFLASIVAASNAGGAGSVIGDTTTTIMWINGVSPLTVIWAYGAAIPAFLVVGLMAAWVQQRYEPIVKDTTVGHPIDWLRVAIVLLILSALIATNILIHAFPSERGEQFPALGVAVWIAILATALLRQPDWSVAPGAIKGALFLVALVTAASLMPVDALPAPSWSTAFILGLVSSIFDNIPLTALALEQGGYDWGLLAYAVGFGGSMVWFGSSAGVAITNLFPEGRSVLTWLRHGWFVLVAYVVGFFVLLGAHGWNPE